MTRRKRRIRHLAQIAALKGAMGAARLVPFRARVALFGAIARAAGAIAYSGRARANLELALGDALSDAQRRAIASANARSIGRAFAEIVDYRRDAAGTAKRRVFTDDTLRFLDDALAAGRGAVVATPHFGNYELFPAYLVTRGYRGAVIGRLAHNPHLASDVLAMRARAGVETLDSRGSPRAPMRVLQQGGIVGVLPDLDSKRVSGTFIPFFGRPAFTATGPASLALLARAPLVTAYMIPEGDRYRLTFEPAIVPDPKAPRDEETLRITREWSRRFEEKIRAHPELWVWVHERWSTTPEKVAERADRRARVAAAKPTH